MRRTQSQGLLPDKLLSRFNDYLTHVRKETGRKVIVFVDHVDKVRDPELAREILVDAVSHWDRLAALLVMTAPYEFTLGDIRSSVDGFWGRPIVLYPEPIPSPVGVGDTPRFYSEIRRQVGLDERLADSDLAALAYYSGGIPRTFVQLLVATVRGALFDDKDTIDSAHVRHAVSEAQSDYQDYGEDDLRLLDEIERSQQGLREAMRLLRSPIGLIIEPQPDRSLRFRAHPLAERSLNQFRRRESPGSAA